jgi:hypothetical protein
LPSVLIPEDEFSNTSNSPLATAATYQKQPLDVLIQAGSAVVTPALMSAPAAAATAISFASFFRSIVENFSTMNGRISYGKEQQKLSLKLDHVHQRLIQLSENFEQIAQSGKLNINAAGVLLSGIMDTLKEINAVQGRYYFGNTRDALHTKSRGGIRGQKKPSIPQRARWSFRDQGKLKELIETLNNVVTELEAIFRAATQELMSEELLRLKERNLRSQILLEQMEMRLDVAKQQALEPAAAEQLSWIQKRLKKPVDTQSIESIAGDAVHTSPRDVTDLEGARLKNSSFEELLYRSRVYRNAVRRHSDSSLVGDRRSSLAVSIRSSISLGEVSMISLQALPLSGVGRLFPPDPKPDKQQRQSVQWDAPEPSKYDEEATDGERVKSSLRSPRAFFRSDDKRWMKGGTTVNPGQNAQSSFQNPTVF